ncbi:MAG: dihydrofolate reductase family protein [Parasphingorhabdus sp.]
MQPVVYDVAVSIDCYISGPDGDISKFAHEGPVVDDYNQRLSTYACAIMGRKTYEFGYKYGLEPGGNPYPHLRTYIFSQTLNLPPEREVGLVRNDQKAFLQKLRKEQDGPIYLCGGGDFAGSLMIDGEIDIIRLKRAPIFLGGGTKLFGDTACSGNVSCTGSKLYDGGYTFQEFTSSALQERI